MTVKEIVGEPCRYWVSSETNPDQRHLVDLLDHECGCASWVCRNRRYRAEFGHNITCKHLRVAREHFLDDVLSAMKEHLSK